MTASETLKLIAKQWWNWSDLMKQAGIGRNNAVPMQEVIKYLNIDIPYLEARANQIKHKYRYEGFWRTKRNHKKDIIIDGIMRSKGV